MALVHSAEGIPYPNREAPKRKLRCDDSVTSTAPTQRMSGCGVGGCVKVASYVRL